MLATPVIHTVTPNSSSIPKYETLEFAVTLSAVYNNPYDFSQVNLKCTFTSPSGQLYIMDGFYFQDFVMSEPDVLVASGPPGWRIRFSPNETGTWTYVVSVTDATGTGSFPAGNFVCTPSGHKGFIKKSGDKLVFNNGETFHALGVNLAFQWWWDGFTAYEDWINALDENGGNFTKLSMAPWIFEIEWLETGLSQYTQRQSRAWVLDWVLDQLEEKEIYCQLNIMIHDELRTDVFSGWNQNPYSDVNGGPCNEPQNFLVNQTAIGIYKQKLRYINARWGYSPQIASWEHISETDNTQLFDAFSSQTLSWLELMTSYIQSIDRYDRVVSTGYAIPQHDPNYWDNYNTDFTQLHIYDFIPDLEMKIYNYTQWYRQTWNKPFIVGEFGLGHDPELILQQDPNGIAFHNTLWSSMFSGSIGSAMSWYWDNYLYPNGLFTHLQPIDNFLQTLNEDIGALHPEVPLCTSGTYDLLTIDPDFNNQNTKAPESYFNFDPSGYLHPTELFLGKYLFGSFYGSRRNPPTFKVNYIQAGQLSVKTGDIAVFSKLKIKVDGTTFFDQTATANSLYTVNIPAGIHEIRIENSGTGLMTVSNYRFQNYAPELRTFVLRNDKYAAGWMQNRKYNWQNVLQNGTPNPVTNGKIFLEDVTPGVYEINWYNPEGIFDSSQVVFIALDQLVLNTPNIVWDGAFEARFISPVNIAFSASPLTGDAPLSVQFTDMSINTGVTINAWNWDFGDGNTASQQNPQHTYALPGVYTVTLQIVTGQYTTSLTKQNYISAIQPLVADFVADKTIVLPNETIQFTDLSLGSPTYRKWNFGDGNLSFDTNPTHFYEQPGAYSVSLFIQSGTRTNTKNKPNYILVLTPLEADFAADRTLATVGSQIHFTDQSLGNPSTWWWNFGNGSYSAQQNPNTTYNWPGTFSVKLRIATNYLADTVFKENYITILHPLSADFTADTTLLWTGQNVHFTDISGGNPDKWMWNFGDGEGSDLQNPVHSYNEKGFYTIRLEISDTLQFSSKTKQSYIRVREPLKADFTVDTTVLVRLETANFTDLSAGTPKIWFWLFGDGFSSKLKNPSHIFKYAGDFTVSLRVTSNDSTDVETKENYIKVIPPLLAEFTADKVIATPGELIHFSDLSTGNPTRWIWDFGAFNNGFGQNPVTSYRTPGTYTITLWVNNAYLSDSVVKESYITIVEPLTANFSVTPTQGKIGEPVFYHNLSTGNPTSWEWWLGNGDTSFLKNPVTNYDESGFYDVTLIVANEYLTDTLTIPDYYHVVPPYFSQTIMLSNGWSGVSSYIQPVFPDVEQIFDPVSDLVFFAINDQGVYRPNLGINTIGDWNPAMGLTIFMEEDAQVTVEGYELLPDHLLLAQGWSVFPVMSPCNQPVGVLSEILGNDIKVLKEIGGWKMYWPEMGISSLESIEPGKLYLIYMNQSRQFLFPACD